MNYLKIPECVFALNLGALELLIYGDVHTMTAQGMKYYRSNGQIAEMFARDERNVRRALANLEERKLLRKVNEDGRRYLVMGEGENARGGRNRPGGENARGGRAKLPGGGGQERPGGAGENALQVNHRVNHIVNQEVNQELPFGDSFALKWAEWIDERKQRKIRKYTPRGEQAALKQLEQISNHDERTAIEIIEQSIAKGWQGLFPIKAPQARDNGQRASPSVTPDQFADLVTRRYQ